jgi:hypothetical protein
MMLKDDVWARGRDASPWDACRGPALAVLRSG